MSIINQNILHSLFSMIKSTWLQLNADISITDKSLDDKIVFI